MASFPLCQRLTVFPYFLPALVSFKSFVTWFHATKWESQTLKCFAEKKPVSASTVEAAMEGEKKVLFHFEKLFSLKLDFVFLTKEKSFKRE